ncbi:MAG: transposase [Actinobacteria bacterium]|nr:transposase [Actinomycetota bacterium]
MTVTIIVMPENGIILSFGKSLQKLRKIVIEGIIGNAKSYHGMGKAKLIGKDKVQMQFLLTASALNLKKMVKILDAESMKLSLNEIKVNFIEIGSFILRKLIFRFAI